MDEALEKILGRRLRKAREMRGLTQKELARQVAGQIDYTYVGKIERGEQLPSLKVLRRIGAALGVPLSYFFQSEEVDLLPEEARRLSQDTARKHLLREIAKLPAREIPLLSEILRTLARHGRSRTREGRTVSGYQEGERTERRVAERRGKYRRGRRNQRTRERRDKTQRAKRLRGG